MNQNTDSKSNQLSMRSAETTILTQRFNYAEKQGLCPECGTQMDEIDRLNEGGSVFIWLRCRRDSCSGNWLLRKSRCERMSI